MLLYLVIGVIVVLVVLLIALVALGLYYNAQIHHRDKRVPWHRRY